MWHKNLLLIIGLAMLVACTHETKSPASTSADVNYQHTDTLRVDIDQQQKLKMSRIFSSITYIPLQSGPDHDKLIGKIRKIVCRGDKIFIFERSTPSVFIYSEDGKFLHQIKIPKGKGPGQLIRPSDMIVDSSNKQMSVLGTERINTYNYSGEVAQEQRLGTIPRKFTLLPGGDFILYMDNYYFEGDHFKDIANNLLYMDQQGNIEKQALPIKKSRAMLGYNITNNFPTYRDHQLFYGSPDHHIYELTADSIATRYYLDFGQYEVPAEMYNNRQDYSSGMSFQKKALKKGYVYFLRNFLETDRTAYAQINTSWKTGVQIFYSKHTRKILVANAFVNDIDKGPPAGFFFRKGNQLGRYFQPTYLIKKAKQIKQKLSDAEFKKYRKRPQNLIDLTKNMSPMDNPVLMLCKVKDSF